MIVGESSWWLSCDSTMYTEKGGWEGPDVEEMSCMWNDHTVLFTGGQNTETSKMLAWWSWGGLLIMEKHRSGSYSRYGYILK